MTDDEGYRLAVELNRRALLAASSGNFIAAIALLEEAVSQRPDIGAVHANLGVLLNMAGRPQDAVASLLRAVQLTQADPAVYNNLSNALTATGRTDEAIAAANRSLEILPDQPEALNALGNALKDQGRLAAAMAAFDWGAELRPDLPQLASNRLFTAHFIEGMTAERLQVMHRQWGARHESINSTPVKRHLGRRDQLRIGYVSPDFRDHPVGRFMVPLLQSHDRKHFRVHCYSSVGRPDVITDHVRTRADRWHEVGKLSDEELATKIRRDGMDILVDLSLHMRGHRLLTFARKPAPVQVTYLGYCSTSGLSAMDYRLTDSYLDPPGRERDALYVERSMRLPETYWCYGPPPSPPMSALPMSVNGFATFGCFNNFCKVTDETLRVWSTILHTLPTARLILHVGEGSPRQRVLHQLDVSAERVTFIGRVPHDQYLRLHHDIDIALDPMPYAGGTTTCDALWMGVPVVSLVGETAVARSGLSILSNVGLTQFVATSSEQYVQIAIDRAGDVRHLSELRRTMRQRMRASPLMNVGAFMRGLEAAYQRMWANAY